ncbi:11036_t:CDS:2 [Entrophospora sp. SA101]|nr:11036_t:CDS:2 [Entrophospora sp. SA101]
MLLTHQILHAKVLDEIFFLGEEFNEYCTLNAQNGGRKTGKKTTTKSTNGIEEIISNNEIKKDIQESKSNDDDFHTPPPNPHNEAVMITSQKPILGEHSIQYLVDAILEKIHGWLVNILLDTFESAIMVSLNPENTFQKVCKTILYDL